MTGTFAAGTNNTINLQATLSSSSACPPLAGDVDNLVRPHHPITCQSTLRLELDGALCCEHAVAPPDDIRTQYCIDHSIALLLIELAR